MKKKLLFVTISFLLSNCEAIFLEDISNESVVLLAPSDNSEVTSGTIEFHWEQLNDTIEYKIQISAPSFSAASQIVLDSITTATSLSKELAAGEYEWRVKAFNSDYSTNYSANSFTVN